MKGQFASVVELLIHFLACLSSISSRIYAADGPTTPSELGDRAFFRSGSEILAMIIDHHFPGDRPLAVISQILTILEPRPQVFDLEAVFCILRCPYVIVSSFETLRTVL